MKTAKDYGATVSFRVSETLGKQYRALPLTFRKSIAAKMEKQLDKIVQDAIDDLYQTKAE